MNERFENRISQTESVVTGVGQFTTYNGATQKLSIQ